MRAESPSRDACCALIANFMTLPQKQVLRELLRMSIENGFGSGFSLKPIGEKLGISDILYDNNTNTGLLWEFGPHGDGIINARGDWPDSYASIAYHDAHMIENWVHPKSNPVG